MISIDGVNYNILLFLHDTTNPSKDYEFEFPDFSEMNQFFKQNRDTPQYANCKAAYTFVEVNEYGESDSYSWTQDIAFKELSVEEIIGLIEEYRQWWTETQEVFAEDEGRMKEIHFRSSSDRGESKKDTLKEYAYVCPTCIHEVEDCRCPDYPYYLVQIDRLMVPIIEELNRKGFRTTGCCAGHCSKELAFRQSGIYICFEKDYDFDEPFPEGPRYWKLKHCLEFIPPISTKSDELEEYQHKTLWLLSDWAEMLTGLSDIDEM